MQSEGKTGRRILYLVKTLSHTTCLQKYTSYSEGSGDRVSHVVQVRLDQAVVMNALPSHRAPQSETCFSRTPSPKSAGGESPLPRNSGKQALITSWYVLRTHGSRGCLVRDRRERRPGF